MIKTQEIISRLSRSQKRLSKSHRKIAQLIETHYDKAVYMTAQKMGEIAGVSESTVVRFAVALGYEGYPQMQKALQEIVRHRLTTSQRFAMAADISEDELLDTVLKTDIDNIKATIGQLDRDVFRQVVDEISRAKTIYVLGLRSAAPLAQFFGHYLHFIFDDVRTIGSTGSDVFEFIARIKPEDTMVAISFPRYSSRTIESMRFARSRGVRVIGITDGALSPLHEASDLCLDAQTGMVSFADSLAAPLSLLNALIATLGVRNQQTLSANFRDMEEVWDTYRIYAGKE